MDEPRRSESLTFSSSVYELTPDKFDRNKSWALKPGQYPKLVFFYVPWCPYCQKAVPLLNKLGNWVEKTKKPILICSFNCELYKERASAIREDVPSVIDAYPSILTYSPEGEPVEKFPREVQRSLPLLKKMCERIMED